MMTKAFTFDTSHLKGKSWADDDSSSDEEQILDSRQQIDKVSNKESNVLP